MSPHTRRCWVCVVGLAAAVLTGCSSAGTTTGSPQCPAPQSTLSTATGAPGEPVHVTGRYFLAACHDTDHDPPGSPPAQREVPLVFEQAGTRLTVDRADARGERYEVELDVAVPRTATPGPARWSLGAAPAMSFTVVAPA